MNRNLKTMKNTIIKITSCMAFSIVCLLLFNSCDEETDDYSRVTIYVGNAGTAQRSAHITARIGDLTETFFTPEGRNMSINDCNSNNSNAAYFEIPPGTYKYNVTDGGKTWNGSFTLSKGKCQIIELSY